MPVIVRWFPVTHDINADPELWELRDLYGDRAALIWLECLSIADRNKGLIGPDSDQTRNQLAAKCRSSRVKVGLVLDWCRVKGWIGSDDGLRVVKWSKYHRTREPENLPSYPNLSEPILNKQKNKNIAPKQTAELKPWPAEDQWLSELLKSQWFLSHCNGELQDYAWWEDTAKSMAGIDRPFIEREFAKMSAWFRENPSRRKTAKGMRRFLRTWLEKAKNQGAQLYAVKR